MHHPTSDIAISDVNVNVIFRHGMCYVK